MGRAGAAGSFGSSAGSAARGRGRGREPPRERGDGPRGGRRRDSPHGDGPRQPGAGTQRGSDQDGVTSELTRRLRQGPLTSCHQQHRRRRRSGSCTAGPRVPHDARAGVRVVRAIARAAHLRVRIPRISGVAASRAADRVTGDERCSIGVPSLSRAPRRRRSRRRRRRGRSGPPIRRAALAPRRARVHRARVSRDRRRIRAASRARPRR